MSVELLMEHNKMEYGIVERDFVERTLELLKQYHTYPEKLQVPNDKRYEVTLLLNCLLGLIVLPYEHCKRSQGGERYPQVLTGDDRLIKQLDETWGLKNLEVRKLRVDGKTLSADDTNLRTIVALIRHSVAHSRFEDGNKMVKPEGMSVEYDVYSPNPIESIILRVNFANSYKDQTDFEASMPVEDLRQFACQVASGFLATNYPKEA
jgi:hypothetical protein